MKEDMKVSRIRLGDFEATDRTRKNMSRVLESGRISYGPMCGEFEARFALLHQSLYGVLSNSGTSSLQVALQALKEMYGWKDGDEVIVPAITFVATANVVLHNNMVPVFVDIDADTFAINPELIEKEITPRTRAIIPVHPFGLPANMLRITSIAKEHDLKVIEDSCEAMGVNHFDRKVGSWGDIGCFSFYVAHILTMGVGGISITSDEELALRMRSLVNHGIEWKSLPQAGFYDPSHLGRHFKFESIGHSYRITEMEAAVGLAQLENIETIIKQRQQNATTLESNFLELEEEGLIKMQQIPAGNQHACMVFPIVSRDISNNEAIAHLRSLGIETREMLPLLSQNCYGFPKNFIESFDKAAHIERNGYYIPCHQYLNSYELDYISRGVLSLYGKCDKPS